MADSTSPILSDDIVIDSSASDVPDIATTEVASYLSVPKDKTVSGDFRLKMSDRLADHLCSHHGGIFRDSLMKPCPAGSSDCITGNEIMDLLDQLVVDAKGPVFSFLIWSEPSAHPSEGWMKDVRIEYRVPVESSINDS